MTKYLITGGNGQLGTDIILELEARKIKSYYAPNIDILDITNKENVDDVISKYKPNIILHCAAYTNVDKAEDEKDLCYNINVNGTKNIIEASKKINSKLIYISTDYVFDGSKEGYYETYDKGNPINYYGKTKYLGELEVLKYIKSFVVRVSWLYGINGNNFVKTMLKLAENNNKLRIINDQFGSPTYTPDLAKFLLDISNTDKYGIYHATNSGITNWYEFAQTIFKLNNINIELEPITTKEYKTNAKRPLNSKLSKKSIIDNNFNLLPEWQDALKRYTKINKKQLTKRK